MRNKGIWILFSAVVLLSLYTYFGEYQGKEKESAAKVEKSMILKEIKQEQVTGIEINNLEQKIVLTRDTAGWLMASPVSDSADNEEIDALLKQLTEEKSLSIAVEGTDIQWKYFGFDKPPKTISIKTSSNQSIVVEVSEKKNFEGNSFIRFPGQNQVLVASSSWGSYVGKKAIELRNKRIFRHQISNVQRISIKNKKSTTEIESKDAKWIGATRPEWSLDQNGVRELITKISEIKAMDFVSEKDEIANAKRNLKLGAVDLAIQAKLSDGDWSAQFYQTKDKTVYAEVAKTQVLVKVANDVFDRLSNMNVSDLRDFKLPFASFDRAKVEKVSYETSLKKAQLVKKGTLWQLEPADTVNEVQQDKVSSLLDLVKNLTAKQYVSKSEIRKDLGKQKLSFKDITDQSYFELQFTDAEKMKINNEEKMVRYAKTNLYPDAFLMEESEFEKLSLNDIVKIKVNSESQSLPVEGKKEEKK